MESEVINTKLKKKPKIIQHTTTVVDINIAEYPLFIGSAKEVTTMGELEKRNDLSSGAKRIMEAKRRKMKQINREKEYQYIPVSYKKWLDKKNKQREILILGDVPTLTTMNVWNGLIALYIHKISPLTFDDFKHTYDIEEDTMYFTLYELAKIMNKSTAGNILNSLMDEIFTLKNTTYYSLSEGIFYIKKDNGYLKSKIEGFSLIVDAKFQSEKREKNKKVTTKCRIQFNRMIVDNIKHEYIKYLNPNEYFNLPSRGYTRRLYLYIKGNMYQSNKKMYQYIKRDINTLSYKLPLDYDYISEFKRKLKKPLKNLIKINLIKDYFYGDEILINGIKQHCLYIIFQGTKQDIINILSLKHKQINIMLEPENKKFQLYIPKNISKELLDLGVSEIFVNKIIKEKNKWEITKYILWAKEEKRKRHIGNMGGMLNFALTKNVIKLEKTHKHIVEYVEEEKEKSKVKRKNTQQQKEYSYQEYVNKEIAKFKKHNVGSYELLYDNLLINLNDNLEKKIAEYNLLLSDNNVSKKDKISLNEQKQEYLDFKKNQENSKLFKKQLQNNIVQILMLKGFDEFKK